MKAVVVLSGGMDSTTVLYDAIKNDHSVQAISFDYGSKHNQKELEFAKYHCNRLGVIHKIIKLNMNDWFNSSALLKGGEEIPEGHYEDKSMKKTVVPFRNGIMLSIAVGFAEDIGFEAVLIGSHLGDRAIYPDCTHEFTTKMNDASMEGTYHNVMVISPFNHLTKKQIVRMGIDEYQVDYDKTWSCYKGGEEPCGKCGTCVERKEALKMKIYFAGEGHEDISSVNRANVLISFFYLRFKDKFIDLKKKYKWNRLFVDSGAFSAWSCNAKINIYQYIDYIKSNYADNYAVLDVIGSAEGTYKNQNTMEKQGVTPLPCFHYGEDFKWLDSYCNSYDYVCLGGMVPISTPMLSKWLDIIFAKYPNQKFHGFGLTSSKLMMDYPWHSVDSSTWIVHMKFHELNHYKLGRLYLGRTKKDFLDIIKNPKNKGWREACEGFNIIPESLYDSHKVRANFNLMAFQEVEDYINKEKPYLHKKYQNTLANYGFPLMGNMEPRESSKISPPSIQRNLKNMSFEYKIKRTVERFFVECAVCEQKYEVLLKDYKKECKFCKSEFVTEPQKTKEEIFV